MSNPRRGGLKALISPILGSYRGYFTYSCHNSPKSYKSAPKRERKTNRPTRPLKAVIFSSFCLAGPLSHPNPRDQGFTLPDPPEPVLCFFLCLFSFLLFWEPRKPRVTLLVVLFLRIVNFACRLYLRVFSSWFLFILLSQMSLSIQSTSSPSSFFVYILFYHIIILLDSSYRSRLGLV